MSKHSSYLFITLFLFANFCYAQPNTIPQKIKTAFAGTWQNILKFKGGYSINTVVIKFEKGKDYATFTDIGTGEAPTITLWARPINDSVLAIQAAQERNDYVELEIIKGKLQVHTRPAIWDADGNQVDNSDMGFGITNFRRVKKEKRIAGQQ